MGILLDGFPTRIDIAGTTLHEKTVTPPGLDGGGAVDVSTMRNTTYRTAMPKRLKTVTDSPFTAAYDPAAMDTLLTVLQVNQLITVTFENGDTVAFWGWLDSFQPNEHTEGEQPTAECLIIASNLDDSVPPVETAPVYTAAP